MSIFATDETAWSALTKTFEQIIQPTGDTLIVQAPTVFRPLSIAPGVNPKLAMFRKLLVGDKIPNYGNKNKNSYTASGASVADAYSQYLQALNVALTTRYASTIDLPELTALKNRYNRALGTLKTFVRAANADWKQKKIADPSLTRAAWDNDYGDIGFTPELKELQDDVNQTYGYWQARANPYPELTRVLRVIFDYDNNPINTIQLPTTDDDLQNDPPESWLPFYKTNLDLEDFFTADAPQTISVNQASATSTSYESRWEAGGSVSYAFFSVGGSAGGGNIEKHLRAGTQRLNFSFKRLVPAQVIRGHWYDEGLLRLPYVNYVDKTEYWSNTGQLPLIPATALVGRGLQVSVDTDSTTYDEFQSWYHSGGSVGFSFGPWSVGGGANSSTSSSSVTNTSTGTTISFTDNSNTPYMLAMVSLKMEEWLKNDALYKRLAENELSKLIREAQALENNNPAMGR